MWNTRSRMAAAILATIALAASGGAARSDRAPVTEGHAESTRADDDPAKTTPTAEFSRIDKRISEIQPTAKEKRFEEIGWARGILEAERLGRESDRPVFLFSNVGQMDLGRC